MNICGREYKLKFTGESGGCFWTQGSQGDGNGEINIGCYKDLRFRVEILFHEVFEAVCVELMHRYDPDISSTDHTRYLFNFTHDDLDNMMPQFLTALLDSGFIKIADPRKKKGK